MITVRLSQPAQLVCQNPLVDGAIPKVNAKVEMKFQIMTEFVGIKNGRQVNVEELNAIIK
jgi:hypothetical protein